MRHILCGALAAGLLLFCLTGCGGSMDGEIPASGQTVLPPSSPAETSGQSQSPSSSGAPASGELSRDEALAIALDNAGVPDDDAYNIKNESDRENGIPVYDIEFETDYGDYDFQVAVDGGRIVGADYEVDEEWLDVLGGSPVTLDEAAAAAAGKVPGAAAEDVEIWEESDDGRSRYEGELFYDNMKYEFELDPQTGIIFDWNADLRD